MAGADWASWGAAGGVSSGYGVDNGNVNAAYDLDEARDVYYDRALAAQGTDIKYDLGQAQGNNGYAVGGNAYGTTGNVVSTNGASTYGQGLSGGETSYSMFGMDVGAQADRSQAHSSYGTGFDQSLSSTYNNYDGSMSTYQNPGF